MPSGSGYIIIIMSLHEENTVWFTRLQVHNILRAPIAGERERAHLASRTSGTEMFILYLYNNNFNDRYTARSPAVNIKNTLKINENKIDRYHNIWRRSCLFLRDFLMNFARASCREGSLLCIIKLNLNPFGQCTKFLFRFVLLLC